MLHLCSAGSNPHIEAGRGPLKGAVSAQKALQASETRELPGMEDIRVFPTRRSRRFALHQWMYLVSWIIWLLTPSSLMRYTSIYKNKLRMNYTHLVSTPGRFLLKLNPPRRRWKPEVGLLLGYQGLLFMYLPLLQNRKRIKIKIMPNIFGRELNKPQKRQSHINEPWQNCAWSKRKATTTIYHISELKNDFRTLW